MAKNKKFSSFLENPIDYTLIITVLLLLTIGLIMVLSASSPTSLSESGNSYKYVIKQGGMALLGFVLMIALSKIDYRIFRRLKWIIYVGCIVLLVLVGLFGTDKGGARRWINILGFSFQPSEFAKVGFILFYASLLSDLKEKNKLKHFGWGFIFPILFLGPIVISIYILQNHLLANIL